MAQQAMEQFGMSIRLACITFSISETCYRYQAKLADDNAMIADWLIRLTHNQKNWGFGLCFLFLRNVKGYPWNHKRVYRIYRELGLNLRIKPKKRIVREKQGITLQYIHPGIHNKMPTSNDITERTDMTG